MILILNNKANLNYEEIKYYEKKLRKYDLIILPSFCYLSLFQKGKYTLGAQDISEFNEHNRTGEINAKQLKSLNVKFCLIGHSEKRIYNKDSDETIQNKINRCIENDIIPLYCIGDSNDKPELTEQLDLFLNNYKYKDLYIIYEPLNNIGNTNPELNNLEETLNSIKEYIKGKTSQNLKIIYGGGVNNSNIDYLTNIKELDGVIVSTESLKIETLKRIYEKTRN